MVPDAGDIAWVEFDPILGSEQAGRRPALVISERPYHEISSRAVVCPITSAQRPWPFHVELPAACRTRGVVMIDQIRTIDRTQRLFDILEAAPAELLVEVRGRLATLLGLGPVLDRPESG